MKILTLMVQYGPQNYPKALVNIKKLFTRQMPDVNHELIVLDTASKKRFSESERNGIRVIGVSNKLQEFGGFDDGIKFLNNYLDNFDLINIATSAFEAKPNLYLKYFDQNAALFAQKNKCAIGNIDAYPTEISIYGIFSQHWLRTSFIFLNPLILKSLKTLAPIKEEREIFTDNWREPFKKDSIISKPYQEYLISWLTNTYNKHDSWHSAFILNESSFSKFKKKAISIMNEHSLSLKLRQNGIKLVDITWFSNQKSQVINIPDWQEQVNQRNLLIKEKEYGFFNSVLYYLFKRLFPLSKNR